MSSFSGFPNIFKFARIRFQRFIAILRRTKKHVSTRTSMKKVHLCSQEAGSDLGSLLVEQLPQCGSLQPYFTATYFELFMDSMLFY